MDCTGKEYTVNSSAVLMSLLSEPISCSWISSEKDNSDNLNMSSPQTLVPGITEKPPIYKKVEADDCRHCLDLNLDLYTIHESSSEENTHRSEKNHFEFVDNPSRNKSLFDKKELCIEDIEDELNNINDVENQTDLILQDLHKEQIQLNEIVNDIDKLFEKDEKFTEKTDDKFDAATKNNNKTNNLTAYSKKTQNKLPAISRSKLNIQEKDIIPEHDTNIDNNVEVSTYGDIVNILEELEKEDIKSRTNLEYKKNDIVLPKKEVNTSSTSLGTCKDYNDLLSYLDEIDQNCVSTLTAAKQRILSITELANSNIRLDAVPKLDDLLQHTNIELANYVIDLTLRLEDKTSSISLLKSEITKLHQLIANNETDREKIIKQKIMVERNKYEPVIKRHQTFIDQLIIDKKELSEKCEGLMSELKTMENRHTHNMQAVEQRHKVEIRRCKDMHEAAEKVKREKWMEAKTSKIKELTVRSVEHEIVSMTEKYQRETSNLKLAHKQEIEEMELRAARKTQQQCEILREQLTMERENAIANEREALKQRFEKLVESEEKGYLEQKRRLKEEHSSRLNELKTKECELETEKDNAIKLVRQECEERLEIAQRRHDIQVTNMKESLRLELEMWKNNYIKQQNIKLTEIESRIRDACKKDRDREIELVIDRLERESEQSKQELELSTENRLRRLKEKYEDEIRQLEKIGQDYKNKNETMQSEILTQGKTMQKLRNSLKELQDERLQIQKVSDALSAEKNNLRNIIKQEFQSEINTLKNEITTQNCKKEKELQDIYTRVKISIARKDEQIHKINEDNVALHEKCKLLENMLEQQRRDYLIR